MKIAVLIGTFIVACVAAGIPAVGAPAPGDRVAPFHLQSPSGTTVKWSPGKVTVISFCAFWCDTWKQHCKRLQSTKQALGRLPVDYLTISVDGRWSDVSAGKIAGTVLLDPGRDISGVLHIDRIPYTLVVDERGVVRFASQGIVRAGQVEESVRECLQGRQGVSDNVVYLTFDDFPSSNPATEDGPKADPDEALLNVLRDNGVNADFFCVCSRLVGAVDVADRAVREGNVLQIHGWDHDKGRQDLKRCAAEITRVAQISPTLYRLPGTADCFNFDGRKVDRPVVNPYDYTRPGVNELKRRILLAVKPGSVILLHAGVSDTIHALPEVIRSLKAQGYRFEVLGRSL